MSRRRAAEPLRRRPTVSVIVPCYNYGHYLPLAVQSALDQPGVDVDVVVIDDASPDGSAAVGASLAASDHRIRFVAHERNRGHIATYNEGLGMVDGDYLVLLSADDALAPGSLERSCALLDRHPEVGFVFGHPLLFVDEVPEPDLEVRSWTVWSGQEWIARRYRSGRNCILCPEVVMRRSVQQRIGGFDADHPHAGDLQLWLRAASVADVGRVNGSTQGFYRVHDQSMQHTVYASCLQDIRERLAAFTSVAATSPGPIAGIDEHLATVRRALAIAALDHICEVYDRGTQASEPVEQYLDFARSTWPGAPASSSWRAVEARRQRAGDPGRGRLLTPLARARWDVANHLRWRRWRWSGL